MIVGENILSVLLGMGESRSKVVQVGVFPTSKGNIERGWGIRGIEGEGGG